MKLLGPVSLLDCLVFVIFLVPHLLLRVGIYQTIACGLHTLPFLAWELPISFARDHYLTSFDYRSPFVQTATPFEDIVIRCVRYAFAHIPPWICNVFFSKWVALPFLRFRLLRHGYVGWPMAWREVSHDGVNGLWITHDETAPPDVVVYYAHGGGFSMGSTYFYLEFLMSWVQLLKDAGYRNPALFALDYTLVPRACHPTQLHQTLKGYQYVLSTVSEPSKICVAGDSAGGTLTLSLLLQLSQEKRSLAVPGLAVLISPWVTLVSSKDCNTASDYLDAATLHQYAHQYVDDESLLHDPLVSPGTCRDVRWWARASPSRGFFVSYGAEEVFAPEIRDVVSTLRSASDVVEVGLAGGIHAWPVASIFLKTATEQRQRGLRAIVGVMTQRV